MGRTRVFHGWPSSGHAGHCRVLLSVLGCCAYLHQPLLRAAVGELCCREGTRHSHHDIGVLSGPRTPSPLPLCSSVTPHIPLPISRGVFIAFLMVSLLLGSMGCFHSFLDPLPLAQGRQSMNIDFSVTFIIRYAHLLTRVCINQLGTHVYFHFTS